LKTDQRRRTRRGLGKEEEYVGEHGTLGEEEDKERIR
jgi:hypothetical protein